MRARLSRSRPRALGPVEADSPTNASPKEPTVEFAQEPNAEVWLKAERAVLDISENAEMWLCESEGVRRGKPAAWLSSHEGPAK